MTKLIIKNSEGEVIKELDANVNRTLLKQLEAEGVEIPAACYTGICGACICEIEKGEDVVDKTFRGEPGFPMGDEEVMTCIAGIKPDSNDELVLKMMY